MCMYHTLLGHIHVVGVVAAAAAAAVNNVIAMFVCYDFDLCFRVCVDGDGDE